MSRQGWAMLAGGMVIAVSAVAGNHALHARDVHEPDPSPWADESPIVLTRSDGKSFRAKRAASDCCSLGVLVASEQAARALPMVGDAGPEAGALDAIKATAAERLAACAAGPEVRCSR